MHCRSVLLLILFDSKLEGQDGGPLLVFRFFRIILPGRCPIRVGPEPFYVSIRGFATFILQSELLIKRYFNHVPEKLFHYVSLYSDFNWEAGTFLAPQFFDPAYGYCLASPVHLVGFTSPA